MKLVTTAFPDGGWIPAEFAFGKPDPVAHIALSANRNPDLSWSGAPPATKSYAIVCVDPDVPSRADDVNREGRVIPASLPRVEFVHWVLVDLPPDVHAIARGAHSDGVVARGKPGPAAPRVGRHAVNDYTGWFATDKDMSGDWYGYDGPCPPWNDEIVHRYVFTVHALDVARLPLEGRFDGARSRASIAKHSLAHASLTGRYTLNPALRR